MTQYWFDEAAGALVQQGPDGTDAVLWLTPAEFSALPDPLPRRAAFQHSISNIQYCKLESYPDCIQGTINVPRHLTGKTASLRFGFYLYGGRLYLVEDGAGLGHILGQLSLAGWQQPTPTQLLLTLFEQLISGDVLILQHLEERLEKLELTLLEQPQRDFPRSLLQERKRISAFYLYYAQLVNLGDQFQSSAGPLLSKAERSAWQRYTSRAERLRSHAGALREYLLQLREVQQTQVDLQQNKIMTLLTIVTTLFLPLTLIVGWYGMNFPDMLAFRSPLGYPAVILLSILTVVLEIRYFKKKKIM